MFNTPLPMSVTWIWGLASKEQKTWLGYKTPAPILLVLTLSLTLPPLGSIPNSLLTPSSHSRWYSPLPSHLLTLMKQGALWRGLQGKKGKEEWRPESKGTESCQQHVSMQGGWSFPVKLWNACSLMSDSEPGVLAKPHPGFWHVNNVR